MVTVKAVKQKKKNLYQILFDNEELIEVSEDILIEYRLLKGKTIEDETFEQLLVAIKSDLAFQQAVNYIDIKMRTKQEVKDYLKNQGYSIDVIEEVIDKLIHLNLLNDVFYSESFMRTKMREGGIGPYQVVQKLIQKGVQSSIAQESIHEYTEEYLKINSIHLAEKLYKRYQGKPIKEQKQKIYQMMIQKGFSNEWTQFAMDTLTFEQSEDEEYELIKKQGMKLLRRYQKKEWWEIKAKLKASLYQKGFSIPLIEKFLGEVEYEYRN